MIPRMNTRGQARARKRGSPLREVSQHLGLLWDWDWELWKQGTVTQEVK